MPYIYTGAYFVGLGSKTGKTEVVLPDLAGWRRERITNVPDDHRFEIVPDWVCEILSSATMKKDRTIKLPLYARHGVAYAWLVDSLAQMLEAFERRVGSWMLIATIMDNDEVRLEPFSAVSFPLSDLWT